MARPRQRPVALVTGRATRKTARAQSAWEHTKARVGRKGAGFPAKYPGKCRRCGMEWRVGDAIIKVVRLYYHAECVAQPASRRGTH